MKNLPTAMDKLEKLIRENKINCFDIVGYWRGEWQTRQIIPALDTMNCFSVAKAFTATAIGIAQDQGLLNVEDTILTFLGAGGGQMTDPAIKDVTIRHLLTYTMGIEKRHLHTADRNTLHTDDWLGYCLSQEWVREATRNQISHIPGQQYGFGMGVFDKGFYFMGAQMQFVVVRKDLGLVLAGHSLETNADILALINETIA